MFSILVVDDNISDRNGIKNYIRWDEVGIETVELAANGKEGYEKALQMRPDFVLTDISMPLMDGIKMTEMVKKELPNAKIIFMSCFEEFEYARNAVKLDVYGYIVKPVNLNEITDILKKVIGIRTTEMEKEKEARELKLQLDESRPLAQEQFFRDLLYGRIKNDPEIQEKIRFLNLASNFRYYTILFIQMDNYEMLYQHLPTAEKYYQIYSMKKCVEGITHEELRAFVTQHSLDSLVAVLFLPSEEPDDALTLSIEYANQCKEKINEVLGIKATVGVGELSARVPDMPEVFSSAEYAAKSKFFSAGNCIILASEVKEPVNDTQYDLQSVKTDLAQLLEMGRASDISLFVEKYYSSDKVRSEKYFKSLSFSIINIVQTLLIEQNLSFRTVFDDELVVWNKLSKFETIVDIRQWIINILLSVQSLVSGREVSRYQKIAEDIRDIIDQRYDKIENISRILDEIHISPSRGNFIFKQVTGKTIFDALIDKRMEVAKQLLADPYTKIYEITEKVGYKTKSYFTAVFKEYTGLTPKDYRDKNCKKQPGGCDK